MDDKPVKSPQSTGSGWLFQKKWELLVKGTNLTTRAQGKAGQKT